jgi:hypothetical protein
MISVRYSNVPDISIEHEVLFENDAICIKKPKDAYSTSFRVVAKKRQSTNDVLNAFRAQMEDVQKFSYFRVNTNLEVYVCVIPEKDK